MIRVKIEEIAYMLIDPKDESETIVQYTDMRPQVTGPAIIREASRVLLIQEFDDLRIEPIIALLNRLRETPPCTCGHLTTGHEDGIGKCLVVRDSGPAYVSGRECGCQRYESRGRAEFREYREKADKEKAISEGRLSEVIQQRERLHSDVARLTRSRDSLRSKKSGAKRR